MINGRDTVILAVLAVRDAEWFAALSRQPAWPWRRTVLLCFNEAAEAVGRRAGLEVLSVFKAQDAEPGPIDAAALAQRFGHPPEAAALMHERTNSGITASAAQEKFWRRFLAIHRLLTPLAGATVAQELGGFAPNLALHAWCHHSGTPELVCEPAPFPGRLLFSRNRFLVDLSAIRPTAADAAAGVAWRDAFLSRPAILMPEKDRLFFRAAGIGKILSGDFQKRVWRKVARRFVLRQREEFAGLSVQFREQLLRLVRSRALRRDYALPTAQRPYIYYPLHVPWDVQLTFRCQACFDQPALLERLIAALPSDWQVVTKEHPAAIGSYPVGPLRRLVHGGRLVLAPPHLNSLELARGARAVVTVNSKVGFEAVCAGLPVVTMGPSFYRGLGATHDVDGAEAAVAAAVAGVTAPDEARIARMLATAWAATVPGDLYVQRPEALAASAAGFATAWSTLCPP